MLENYPDVLTVHELAEIPRAHHCTVYELLRSGEIPHLRIGSAYRISKRTIPQYLYGEIPQSE
mgnify:CR=1 FL=1